MVVTSGSEAMASKKKTEESPSTATPADPGPAMAQMPNPGMGMPGAMPMGQNPMMQMMQMMQMMMGGMGAMAMPNLDPAAMPFTPVAAQPDGDQGLDADIIRPARIVDRVRTQQAVPLGSVLDLLCLTEDAKNALGGIPKGCTVAFAGPPGKGKTRTALAGLARVAAAGERVAFVIAEEGFRDEGDSGRDDLCSRLVKIGEASTGLSGKDFETQVLDRMYVLECQYHKGTSWDDFVGKYRYLVEKEKIRFVVIDSLNMLDPSRNRTADNLSALKTYNHEQGITCLCLGQIRDTGMPVGGEALAHTADAVFLIEELSLGSKEMAEQWGGKYRDRIDIISVTKSVTTPRFEYPIRVGREPKTGVLVVHESQPAEYAPLLPRG
jgi:KaiC/GvpD/RAD55 family RecA-like ATPase